MVTTASEGRRELLLFTQEGESADLHDVCEEMDGGEAATRHGCEKVPFYRQRKVQFSLGRAQLRAYEQYLRRDFHRHLQCCSRAQPTDGEIS